MISIWITWLWISFSAAAQLNDPIAPSILESTQKGSKEFGCEESSRLPDWLPESKELVFKSGKWKLEQKAENDLIRGTCAWSFNLRPPPGKQVWIVQQSIFVKIRLQADSAAHFRMETFSPGTSGSKLDEPIRAPAGVLSRDSLLKAPMRLLVRCNDTGQIRINASVVMNPKPLAGKSEVDVEHAVLGLYYEDCPKN